MIYNRTTLKKAQENSFDKMSDLSLNELEIMFLSVPVRSLREWAKYFTDKDQPEICRIIQKVSLYRI